ncbi:hypothetical protein DINM_020301 [Dirofilaria immitis]|nr:hypothetical protein [Dirofilaria immitis]
MFGNSKGTGTGFTFGSTSTTANTTVAVSTPGTTKPLFSFGNTTTSSASTSATQSSGFSFGSTSKPLFGGAAISTTSTTGATTGFSFGSTVNKATGNIFGSTFPSSANAPSTTVGSGFTFGAKPAGGSDSLFGIASTTASQATTATTTTTTTITTTPANTTASLFSSSLAVFTIFIFSNFISQPATSGGLLFGAIFDTSVASAPNAAPVTTNITSPFSFGASTSNSQPTGFLFGLSTSQPITAAASPAPTVSASATNIFSQKPASGGLFGQTTTVTASTVPTTGFVFSSPTTAKSTFGSATILGTAAPAVTTVTTTAAAPALSFGFNTTTTAVGTTTPFLFGSATSSLTTTTATPTTMFGTTSTAAPSFAGLFGNKTISVTTPTTVAVTTSVLGLNDSTVPTLTSPLVTSTNTTMLSLVLQVKLLPPNGLASTAACFAPTVTAALTFGSSTLAPTLSALPSAQSSMSITSTTSTAPLFGVTPSIATSVTTIAPTGFAFGQSTTTTTTPTAAISTTSLPIMTSFLQSTSTPSAATISTVTSAGSALSSLLYPSKTTATTLSPTASTLTFTSAASTTSSSALASAAPAATAITSDKPITFAQLEQLVNRLTLDVEAQQRVFMSQVLELNAYDRVLRENQQKVLDVSEEIKQLEEEKDRFLHTIDFISQQQTELEALVVDLEKALGLSDWTEMAPIGLPDPSIATHADMQRQAMLQLQLQIDAQLKQADDDINDIIEQVKELQRSNVGMDDEAETADQIAQILRRQLDALQWIDEQSFGLSCMDIINYVRSYPVEDSDSRILKQIWTVGGNATNNVIVLNQLNSYSILFSAIPNDCTVITSLLTKVGISSEHCLHRSGGELPTSTVIVNETTGSRTIMHYRGQLQEPNCEEFQLSFPDISIFSWIHFEGRNFENLITMIKYVRLSRQNNERPKISIECEKVRDFDTLENAIPLKKGFQNKEEAVFGMQQQYGASHAIVICPWAEQSDDAIINILEYRILCNGVIIKLGAAARDTANGELISVDAYVQAGPTIDTLGAGDCFIACCIHFLNNGNNLREVLVKACRITGKKVTRRGLLGLDVS